MKQSYDHEYKYDDDNIEQIGDDEFMVINYDEDTMFLIGHHDTLIEGKHIVIDTIQKNDTIYIETHTYDKELQVINKLIDSPHFGKSVCSVLILVFVAYTVWSKWNCNKSEK